jgi:CheY-like chemotaxis protein
MATILVVDDEPDLALLAKVNLERHGHCVITAHDGDAALTAVGETAPDVLLLDVMMPETDGWTVLERLKAHGDERVRTIPVIMLTAIGEPIAKARGGIEGAVRWLTKPVDADELVAAVADAMDEPEPAQRRRAQSEALVRLARIERGDADDRPPPAPGPKLTSLERPRPVRVSARRGRRTYADIEPGFSELTIIQRHVLEVLRTAPTAQAAAAELGTSRSSMYASLRRAARRLGFDGVSDLLEVLRRPSD